MLMIRFAVILTKSPCQLHRDFKDAINFITSIKLRKNTTRYQFEGSNTKHNIVSLD
jgi:hypothetical protein